MEVAGLLLGAAGLIVPAYQAVQKLTKRINDIKNFPKTLRNINATFAIQKKLFDNECLLLFSSEFDEGLIRAMLSNEHHPMWGNREFQEKFKKHLGDYFDQSVTPFAVIRETVQDLEVEMQKVTVEKVENGSKAGTLKRAYRKLQRPSESPNLEALVAKLRAQILDLLSLRRQREAAQKRRYRSKVLKSSSGVGAMADQLRAVMEVQKASKRVYTAIASVANCSCHRFYLQLQYENTPVGTSQIPARSESPFSGSTENSCFRLVLTSGDGENAVSCTCIAVRKDADPSASPPPPAYSFLPPQEAIIPRQPKQIRFADAGSSNNSFSSLNTTLTDLCSTVRSSHPAPSYLGALPSTDLHRHLYNESVKSSISRISLPHVFELATTASQRTRPLLSLARRYRLAWILSASLLRFGFYSASWFRENWRSGDIYFLQEADTSALDFPHISVRFSSSPSSSSSSGTCLAKNEQLYSLAIALIEIAFGDTLKNLLSSPAEKPGAEWTHAREYAGAKFLMDGIAQVMGRRYAFVVERCFWCNFAIDVGDTTPEKLQKAYYETVECELRGCMAAFLA